MKNSLVVLITFLLMIFNSVYAQNERDSLKLSTKLDVTPVSYLDYKLKDYISDSYFSNSLNLMLMNGKKIGTESLSDLDYALKNQYNFKYNDDMKTFKTILGGIGTAAALSLGAVHIYKYGKEYFKRNKKD